MDQTRKDFYRSNLDLLEKNHPLVWKQFLKDAPEPMGTIFYTPGNAPNLTVSTSDNRLVTLHKESDPETESDDLLKKILPDHKGFVSVLGMGLGYHILHVLKNRPLLQHLAVFELEPGIFLQALKHMDLSSILEDPRLILRIGQGIDLDKSLEKAFRTLQLEDANIFDHFPSLKFDPEGYTILKNELYARINSLNVGGATTRALGKDFMKNRFAHLSTIHHHFLLETLQNKFTKTPAILVAGGPSLDKNIRYLKKVQEHAVIFSVDTALPALLKNEIRPHFLTSIDPNNLTYEKFADVIPKVSNISLICSSWVNLRTPKIFPAKQVFWTFTAKPVEAWINTLLGGSLMTGGASTVAHLNLIAANILGCDPIIFIGQDLAFPSLATHADGTVLQGSSQDDLSTRQSGIGNTVKGIDGSILKTNRSFLSMKEHFEAAIAKAPQTHINATEGGAHIEGTTPMTLLEAIDQYCKSPAHISRRINEYAADAGRIDNRRLLSDFNKMQSRIKALLRKIKESDKIANSIVKEVSLKNKRTNFIKSFANLSNPLQNQIHRLDAFHKELDNVYDIWQFLEEITMDGLKDSERRKKEIGLFENDPQKYSQWLLLNLRRLIEINKIRKESLILLDDGINQVLSMNENEQRICRAMPWETDTDPDNKLKLAKLYINTGNYNLAKPLVDDLLLYRPESAELNYFAGCIAKLFNEHEKAEQYFNQAREGSHGLHEQIQAFETALGNDFLNYAEYFKKLPGRKASTEYMIFKGLTCCPGHHELQKELEGMLETDLKTAQAKLESKETDQAESIIMTWDGKLGRHPSIAHRINKKLFSRFLFLKGKFFIEKKEYHEALDCFRNALKTDMDNHDLHFITIDTCFMAHDYDGAVMSIENATRIDKKFAAYWETIGDSLRSAGQNEDAIIAYERCFIHIPENFNLIKKMGDCYLALGHLEAAKAAFEQFKLKLENK